MAAPQTPRGRGPREKAETVERDSLVRCVGFKVTGKPTP